MQEEYEKKIGLLTYLGQDSQELTGDKSWWQTVGDRGGEQTTDKSSDKKQEKLLELNDPMKDVRDYMGCKGIQKIIRKEESRKRKRDRDGSCSPERGAKKRKKAKKERKSERKKHKKEKKGKRKKRHKRGSSESSDAKSDNDEEKRRKLERLREERLIREKRERIRTDKLLYGKSDLEETKKKVGDMTDKEQVESQRKYNNQFNPQHAKQNRLDANKKYWLE